MKYFARANSPQLPPGRWIEVTETKYKTLRTFAKMGKSTTLNFHKGGIETLVISDEFNPETYRHVYPDLYELLTYLKQKADLQKLLSIVEENKESDILISNIEAGG